VRAGYFHEPDQWVGIAHVLEHMVFKGTARRGPGELAAETQRLGGYLNASTIYDKTAYWVVLPAGPGALERAVDLQADALMASALDPGELARELEVIVQEAKRKLDHPPAVATETLYQLLFQTHRMRRWRIGTEAGLRQLGADDVRSFYHAMYAPDRVIVAAVGRLDPAHALAVLRSQYGQWRRSAEPLPAGPEEPVRRAASFRALTGDVTRPVAALGWRTVGPLHPDAPALDVLGVVAGNGLGSRLWQGVRSPGWASSVSASHYTPTEVGVFQVSLEAEPTLVDQAVTQSLSIMGGLVGAPPDPAELSRARSLIQASWAKRAESMDGRATLLCEFEALEDFRLADTWLDRLLAVTADDVGRVAAQHLATETVSGVLYLSGLSQTTFSQMAWPPSPVSPPPRIQTPLPGAGPPRRRIGTAQRANLSRAVTAVTLDGAHGVVCPRPGAGLVSLSLSILGLRAEEREDTAGLTALLVRSALRGAGDLDAEALALVAETLGGAVMASAGGDAAGWSLTVPVASAAPAARLLVALLRRARLEDHAIGLERGLLATDAARARDDMFGFPLQAALEQAYPRHHYGLPVLGRPDLVPGLAGGAVRDLAARARQVSPLLIAAGDLSENALVDVLVGAWEDESAPVVRAPRPPSTAEWVPGRGAETRQKAQTALAMAFPAHGTSTDWRASVDVLCAVLGGMAGRLFLELRDRRSLAYTVTASPWFRRDSGAVLTYIATSPEREDEARAAMLEELQRVTRQSIAFTELERARNYAAGLAQIRRQRVAAWSADVLEGWALGALVDVEAFPDRLRAVTAEQLAAAAREIFRPEQRAE
ncbi:MAG TPA: pitrilysin family protein, partial [Gemmatimonadales bacterium]|nr:pitrilysin family protein [Gemmatimonadales bacterium]